MFTYCCDEFGQALGFVPRVCLLFEMLDAIGVGVCGVRIVQGGFPVLPCRLLGLLVCVSALFRGFASEVDFLRDFGKLVFQGRPSRSVHSLPRCGVPPGG
ncbi:hypothetical protein [Streptomyces niveus]|uniref:hypothetical protein n=1 Tax=Streptomyces niveus TaxID=193462 RepID=UPI00342DC443